MEKHELVDRNGTNTGKILTHVEVRNLDNIPEGYYIPVVGIVIINSSKEILLQKRSSSKRTNPGKWGICGGKIDANESVLEAAVRETKEEIGVELEKEDLKFLSRKIVEKIHFTVYYIYQEVDISQCTLQVEEVEELKYVKIDELEELDNEGFEWLENLKEVCYS